MVSLPAHETNRLTELQALVTLGNPPSNALNALVETTRRRFGVPVCVLTLVEREEIRFVAISGLEASSVSRHLAFCDEAIRHDDLLVVEDARQDPRFCEAGLVTGPLGVRFYAGAPLVLRPGLALGTLCLIDSVPRTLSPAEAETLRQLALVAMALIDGHRTAAEGLRLADEAEGQRRLSETQSRELRLRSRQFERSEELAKVGGWAFDTESQTITWSDELYRICEIPIGTPVTLALALSVYSEPERQLLATMFERAMQHGTGFEHEFRIVAANGTAKWVRAAGDVELVDGVPTRLFGILQDISQQHASALALWHTAHHDALTGLANRAYAAIHLGDTFSRRDEASAAAIESGEAIGLLMVDVDRLKEVNDTLGHAAGDVLLRTVATRLTAAVGHEAMVARIGGDEFKVMFRQPMSARRLESAGRTILAVMQEKLRVEDRVITPQVSIGGALSTAEDTPETLRQKADLALYESKRRGRGGYAEFREDMRAAIVRRIDTIRSVDDALLEGRIVPFYQPIVQLETCRLTGVEALARMIAPNGGVVSAGAFQEALAEPRIAHALTTAMLRQVAADMRRWIDRGLPVEHVGINVTSADFRAGDLRSRLLDAFGRFDVPIDRVLLEVTETIFLDDNEAAVVKTVDDLRRDGLRVALDDFGTGFASLTHLRSLPVDVIKIDKSFVDGMLTEATSGPIVEALIELSRKLGLQIIAEGIEHLEQAEHLRALGCPLGQGFFFDRPANATTTAGMLQGFGARSARPHGRRPRRVA